MQEKKYYLITMTIGWTEDGSDEIRLEPVILRADIHGKKESMRIFKEKISLFKGNPRSIFENTGAFGEKQWWAIVDHYKNNRTRTRKHMGDYPKDMEKIGKIDYFIMHELTVIDD